MGTLGVSPRACLVARRPAGVSTQIWRSVKQGWGCSNLLNQRRVVVSMLLLTIPHGPNGRTLDASCIVDPVKEWTEGIERISIPI
jgi:hypothetical protein